MDTDHLSNEAFTGIIIEAEKFNHDLTLYFGALASGCKDEEAYLKKASVPVSEIRALSEEGLMDLFFGKLPDTESLNLTLDRMIENIDQVRKIPKEQRHYEF